MNNENHDAQLTVPGAQPLLRGLDPAAVDFARASKSRSTARAYGQAWRGFLAWCESRNERPMPASPEAVANYIAGRAGEGKKRPATIQVDVAAIRQAHLLAGEAAPTSSPKVLAVVAGIRRTLGVKPDAKEALSVEHMLLYCDSLPETLPGVRDRAMLLLGFCGAFRRSELVGLRVEDLKFVGPDESLIVELTRSKTDQEGSGLEKVIHATGTAGCPVASVRRWLSVSGIDSGPLFRAVRHGQVGAPRPMGPGYVAELVKRAAAFSGLDEGQYAGHSLRSGFVTKATEVGVSLPDVMQMTKHRRAETVLVYVRRAEGRRANVTSKLGL